MKGGQVWNAAKTLGKTNAQMITSNSTSKSKEKKYQYVESVGQP